MLGRVAYFAAQRVMTCDVWHLLVLEPDGTAPPTCDERFTFRLLSADEVAAFAIDPKNCLDPTFAERMQFGYDVCVAGLEGDQLACYCWYALGSIEAEHNRSADPNSGVAISFAADTAFAYNAYTRPEYRGRRLQPVSAHRALELLSARGITRLIAATDWCNRSSLRCCEVSGFRGVGKVWRFGWGPATVTITPKAAKNFGIRFGTDAAVQERIAPPSRSRQSKHVSPGNRAEARLAKGWKTLAS